MLAAGRRVCTSNTSVGRQPGSRPQRAAALGPCSSAPAHTLPRGPLVQEGPGLSAIDLEAAFARLAAATHAPGPRALRFLAAYTDGGTDGGDTELHYRADHAFSPQVWCVRACVCVCVCARARAHTRSLKPAKHVHAGA